MQVILVGGSGPTAIISKLIGHLAQHGITILEHQLTSANWRAGAEGVILINTIASHGMSDKAHEMADSMGVPYASVSHKWAHAVPVLKAKGFLPPDVVDDDEEDDDMANGDDKDKPDLTGQVKSIMGPQLGELRDDFTKLQHQLDALESLLADDRNQALAKLDAEFRAAMQTINETFSRHGLSLSETQVQLGEIRGLVTHQGVLAQDAFNQIFSVLKQLGEQQQAQEAKLGTLAPVTGPSVIPRPQPVPVSTKPVAEAMLADLKARFPHPFMNVNMAKAAAAIGVHQDHLTEALNLLYEDKGLDQDTLAVLHQCGWRLALVQPGSTPRTWILADGSTLPVVVAEPAPASVLEPVLTLKPRPGYGEPQDDSQSGRIFTLLLTGDNWSAAMVAARLGLETGSVCKLLLSLSKARKPRHGMRVVQVNAPDAPHVLYKVIPWVDEQP